MSEIIPETIEFDGSSASYYEKICIRKCDIEAIAKYKKTMDIKSKIVIFTSGEHEFSVNADYDTIKKEIFGYDE